MKKNYEYYNTVVSQLERQAKEEEENIEKAAQFCADSICRSARSSGNKITKILE